MKVLRTPDESFQGLANYSFKLSYCETHGGKLGLSRLHHVIVPNQFSQTILNFCKSLNASIFVRHLLGFFCGILILASPAWADEESDAEKIRDTIISMWAAVERGDVDGYLNYVHPNYTLFGENDIYLQSGKVLERSSYEDYLSRYKNIRTFMHQPQFHVRGDTAWVTYHWSDSGFARENGERFTSQGKSTRIFVKENGKWLCIHGHFTSVDD